MNIKNWRVDYLFMTRTKQTARKSTGGKAPRKSHAKRVLSPKAQEPENMRSVYEKYTVARLKELIPKEHIKSSRPGKAPLKNDIIDSIINYEKSKILEEPETD